MRFFSNLFSGVSASFKAWRNQMVHLKLSVKKLTTATSNLQAAVPELEEFSKDMERSSRKLAYKNKPHLDRINEANDRIQANLTEIQNILSRKKSK
ncbi:hypothetical protein ACRHK7_06340 [Weissella tructae]|uniref:Uncharacterized protein n=2 Tax=Weissella TaxID=46255 RepID=A0A075TVE7_9LACO|nr:MULTISPECIES: hypothetical protein [Weissella]AIG65534.1 hypothetical protein WS08_0595 [Weissella tructae]AIM62848.1 hypothetical protein WS74_0596 [Weissella ceti]AIM64183.1 hypothetical protein WS105_0593 [Weissella ceti]ELA07006.1 hypothetical protein WCNC_05482 [Weissella ceti NC36]QVV91906.1 hypothetical protein KHQ32_03240 [Weissella tructae]